MRGEYIHSLNSVKRVIYEPPLNHFQTSIQSIMQNFADIRLQLIADLLDSHLSFDAVRATTDWEQLTCLEQMTLEDLLDM